MVKDDGRRASLLADTLDAEERSAHGAEPKTPWLTILHHPVLRRVGEEASLEALDRGAEVELSRTAPDFTAVTGSEPWPLADPFLSRKPLLVRIRQGWLELEPDPSVAVNVEGEPLSGVRRFSLDLLDRGLVVELAGRVLVLLHRRPRRAERLPELGLVGWAEPIDEIRRAVIRVADLSVPVLIRGETGSGKELVARALHEAGPRARRAFEAINVGALAPHMAAAELFGHVKGAFTGAVSDNPGYFVRANGGTLMLDEVGEAPIDLQVALLRVLETSTIQRVGDQSAQKIDVRVISATDANLERAIEDGRFRSPLLHRLRGYEIFVPALRERREDLGRLILHFVRLTLAELGQSERAEREDAPQRPWFPASVARELLLYDWPGNVRELRNVVRQLLISNRERAELGRDVLRLPRARSVSMPSAPEPAPRAESAREVAEGDAKRRPRDVSEDELIAALERHRWKISPAARELGIGPSSLHMLIDRSTRVRKANDVSEAEIRAAEREVGRDPDLLAAKLRVSSRGLRLRLKALGLE